MSMREPIPGIEYEIITREDGVVALSTNAGFFSSSPVFIKMQEGQQPSARERISNSHKHSAR